MLAQESVGEEIAGVAGETADDGINIVQDIKDSVSTVVDSVAEWAPKLVGFLIILVIGYFVAKFIARIVKKIFKKINFDYYVDKAGIGAPLERAGFKDSGKFAGKIVYLLIMLFVLQMAFGVLGIDELNEPFNKLIEWIPKALIALVLVVIGGVVANTVRDLVRSATMGQGYSNLVTKAAFVGVWLLFGLAALDTIEIGQDLVDTVTTVLFSSLGAIVVIKFGIGGIWAARDRFWPAVYDSISSDSGSNSTRPQA